MLLIFLFEVLMLVFMYFCVRGRYEIHGEMGKNKNRIISLIFPIAYFIVNSVIAGRFTAYERKLNSKLSELYGGRDIRNKAMLHIINKTMAIITAILAVTLLGAFMEKPDLSYVVFALAVLLAVFYSTDRELSEKLKKRNFHIQYDFPDFLNKLVLLINAGMTVTRAWEKIVCDREVMTPLYEELNITYLEIKNGKPEIAAYEDFARRCRVKEITKFITAIIQNLRKGNAELVSLLKLQSNECWQLRKSMARRLGEEASTKLVLPLMIMFIGILIIVMLPAVMQLKYL